MDDGSCIDVIYGCTDPNSSTYNPNANTEDGSCEYVIFGCTDPDAYNYNPDANTDNGSCVDGASFISTSFGVINYPNDSPDVVIAPSEDGDNT